MTTTTFKLPRQVEADPARRDAIARALTRDQRPLWQEGRMKIAHVSYTAELERALKIAIGAHQVERGLEGIETLLNAEQKGIQAVHEKKGTEPGPARISRLLILPDGCGERFYRTCETVLYRHQDRVLGLRLIDLAFEQLAEKLFKPDALVKALLISDKDAVANVLLALVAAQPSS
ncbi:MAG: hypothetical protein HY075_11495 [Deltaproteobacteria bacterium]|nr:hypothetical protein [Deltaproteobacteria bacterium]